MRPAVLDARLPRPLSGPGVLAPHNPTGHTRLPTGCERIRGMERVGGILRAWEVGGIWETKGQGQGGVGSQGGVGTLRLPDLQTPAS